MATTASKTVPPAIEFSSMLNQLEGIISSFDSRFKALTPDLKKAKSRVGIKRKGFLETAHGIARENTDYVPAFFDIAEFDRTMTAMKELSRLRKAERMFHEYIRNAEIIINNEAYHNALSIYGYLREATKRGRSGAKSLYEGLKKQFPSTKRSLQANTEASEGSA
jgi:hypothetical protein